MQALIDISTACILQLLTFIVTSSFFLFLDKCKILQLWKLNYTTYFNSDIPIFKQLAVNEIITIITGGLFYYALTLTRTSQSVTIFQLIELVVLEDIFFYTFHRLLHHPRFYRRYHSQHHVFREPYALVAIYASGVEHFLSNLLPVYLSAYIVGLSWQWCMAWFCIATANAAIAHSGYVLGKFHNLHHLRGNVNYGILGMMDRTFGTFHD